MATSDDRSTRARIRDAAIAAIARDGIGATTARRVAAEAGMSAGSVIHHFGSMEGLRRACDEHVTATIRQRKREAVAQGPGIDLVSALRDTESEFAPLLGYLAQVLTEDSDAVAKLVDDLVGDAVGYMEEGIANGMVRPTDDPHARTTVLMIWSLGALVLHHHLDRLLGVDLAEPDPDPGSGLAAYAQPAWAILAEGVFTPAFARAAQDVFASTHRQEDAS